ncbi:YIEGIA family protein [Metallumcola ferriviriculae]|uniref:YIEGIA family protein n=1 Tax=Metallumcola ferriviriculae TaxID=3039180 RepID=A0AAU0URW7_9FIRM|nr:YIEGIA family protein [Desulfitibacteraceae bacterium MK1]
MNEYVPAVVAGLIMGTIARVFMLRSDYRQFPGYPHGYVTHLGLGVIAAGLGAVAVPALMEQEFAAVTFLALAAQQFRDIRNMERESLAELEELALVPRGKDYIEGIARVFESRNYLVMFTALMTSLVTFYTEWYYGILAAILVIYGNNFLMKGKVVGEIADIVPCKLHFKGALLMVDNIVIMNVGLTESREKILKEGLGVLIKPKDDDARATLNSIGQRQAILQTAASLIGSKKEVGELDWTPLARKDIDTGKIGLYILPNEPDIHPLIEAIKMTPVLESSKVNPLQAGPGRRAAD